MADNHRNRESITICLLGASLRTGNLGVTGITESTIHFTQRRWPGSNLVIVGTNAPLPPVELVTSGDRQLSIPVLKMFVFSKRLGSRNHIVRMLLYRLKAAIFPRRWVSQSRDGNKSDVLNALMRADLVLDASSGDGFTDLYGLTRFYKEAIRKWLVLILGRKLVLLPQTIGPFRNPLYRAIAAHIVRRSHRVFVRDSDSLNRVRRYAGLGNKDDRIKLVPDITFALGASDPHGPPSLQGSPENSKRVIGINVSGLLLNRPRLQDFGLKSEYEDTVHALIEVFLSDPNISIILMPNVFGIHPESDETACQTILDTCRSRGQDRVEMYAHQHSSFFEAQDAVSGFEFFLGARMHACIAALTRAIPVVGLAYSGKFAGVFETVGLKDCVVDLRMFDVDEIVAHTTHIYDRRGEIAEALIHNARQARARVSVALDDIQDY